jgi:hypothetical protein
MRPLAQWMWRVASIGLLQYCVGRLTPCFAVEAFELGSGEASQGAPKSRSTVPSVVEHGGERSTS